MTKVKVDLKWIEKLFDNVYYSLSVSFFGILSVEETVKFNS